MGMKFLISINKQNKHIGNIISKQILRIKWFVLKEILLSYIYGSFLIFKNKNQWEKIFKIKKIQNHI